MTRTAPPAGVGPLCGLVSLLLSLLAAEFGFRALAGRLGVDAWRIQRLRSWSVEGVVENFAPRPYIGYAMPLGRPGVNSLGFQAPEWRLERTPGVLRIACLGGSTTQGGNSLGHAGSYPFLLERSLTNMLGRPVEVLNFGIASWTSAEMVCAWFLIAQDFAPDLVILHEVVNDTEPRNWPGFRADYSHYRKPWDPPRMAAPLRWLIAHSDLVAWKCAAIDAPSITDLTVREPQGGYLFWNGGIPDETMQPYRRNLLSIGLAAQARGAQVMLATLPTQPLSAAPGQERRFEAFRAGIAQHNDLLRSLAAEQGWMLCDLDLEARRIPEAAAPRFIDLVHVDPLGNQWKAHCIARMLVGQWDVLQVPPVGSGPDSRPGSGGD